jgi:surface protein
MWGGTTGNIGDTGMDETSAPTFTDEFAMTITTTTANETFTIPCQDVGTFDAGIQWGDGSVSSINAYDDARLTHTYAAAGDHLIRIRGTFPSIYFNNGGDKLKVKSVENFGVVGRSRCGNAFWGCSNMTSFVSGNTDTSSVTDMTSMFRDCSSLTSLDVTGFDTSAVTSTRLMFRGCSSLTSIDVSGFNTAAVTKMSNMFLACSSLTDVVGVEDFNIEGLNSTDDLTSFMTGVTLPTARYDALLVNWDAQEPFDGMSPNFGSSTYTAGGTAATARANLISTDGWTITDGGIA